MRINYRPGFKRRKHRVSTDHLGAVSVPTQGRRLRMEALEDRRVLAAVSWDGGGDGVNWSDPDNWSGNALPTSADDVTISVGGTITVIHASGSTTIQSLTSDENLTISGGSLTVTTGASNVNGDLTVSSTATLSANGATATLTANASVTLDGANLSALSGGLLDLTTATSYVEQPSVATTIQANGTSSKVDLSGITSITGTGNLNINAVSGGTIELDALVSTTARDININVDGASSVLDLTALTSAIDSTRLSNLTLANGGTLVAPVFATYQGGTITVNNMSVTFSALTDIDTSSLFTNSGGVLSLPNVTSYDEAPSASTTFRANGTGSMIDLTPMTSITGTGNLNINAVSGGTIELDALVSTTARDININVDGASSVLDLTALTSAIDSTRLSNLTLANGGTLVAPVFATYQGGTITVNNMTATFSALTDIDSSSLFTNSGGVLSLPNVTSYDEAPFSSTTFQASGTGSLIDLTPMTSITGATGSLNIRALAGGTIELDALTSTTARDINMTVDGASSVLDLTVLTSVIDTTRLSNLTLANGGTLVAPVLATYQGTTIAVNNMSATLSALTDIDTSSLFTNSGGVLSLPNVTSYDEAPSAATTFQASGAGSTLDLTPLTSITGTGNLNINALGGGTVEVDSLVGTTARDINMLADGATSLVDASALTSWNDSTTLSNLTTSNSGTVMFNAGTVTLTGVTVRTNSSGSVTAGSLILDVNSPLSGNGGSVDANLTSNQLVSPGVSPGTITVNGDYNQGASADFAIEINGLTPGTQYDQLQVNGAVALAGELILSGSYVASVSDSFVIIENDGVDPVVGTFDNSPEGDIYTFNDRPLRLSYQGGDGNDVVLTRVDNLVVARHIFYNDSFFDGNNAAININDDSAIDPTKTAYLPGAGPATFQNVTGYDKGINGIMVDISGDGTHASISATDFTFKVGNNNTPSSWAVAPAPTAVTLRPDAGYRGADRLEITWANGAVQKEWLEVIALSTANTGLADIGSGIGDVFFWGNAVGGSGDGDTATQVFVNATDEIGARNNPHSFGNPAAVDDQYDYNKDRFVNATDQLISRNNSTNFATALRKIDIGTGGPFAPEGDGAASGDATGDAGVASALAASGDESANKQSLPANVAVRLESAASAVATALDASLLLEAEAIDAADDVAVDDELLDVLAASLT